MAKRRISLADPSEPPAPPTSDLNSDKPSKPSKPKTPRAKSTKRKSAKTDSTQSGSTTLDAPRPGPTSAQVEDYWFESTRPLASLLFVAPMLLAYELAVLVQGSSAARNGADVWLRQLLDWLGFSQHFLLPALTCSVLLGWHHVTHQRWWVSGGLFSRMSVESLVLAIGLLLGAQAQSVVFSTMADTLSASVTTSTSSAGVARDLTHVFGYLGAGIYEELMFRLLILPALYGVFHVAGGPPRLCLIMSVGLSALLFTAAHYQFDLKFAHWNLVLSQGYSFDWFSFIFRFWAGVFFGLLFVHRGFGIAVGAHALYDILAIVF